MNKNLIPIAIIVSCFFMLACGGGSAGVNIVDEVINQPPTVNAGIDLSVDEESNVTLSGTAADADGSIKSYLWVQVSGEPVLLTNPETNIATFQSPTTIKNITLEFEFKVTDSGGVTKSDMVLVTVNPINEAPIIIMEKVISVIGEEDITLSAQVNDSDGNIAAIEWTQTKGPAVVIQNPDLLSTSFKAPIADETIKLQFELLVTDNEGASGVEYLTVTVSPKDEEPNDISFTLKAISNPGEWVESEAVEVSGFNIELPINIYNGAYSINDGEYITESSVIKSGDILKVRHRAAFSLNAVSTSLISIGNYSSSFVSLTKSFLGEEDNRAIDFIFPNSEAGTNQDKITIKGLASDVKGIKSIKVNGIEASLVSQYGDHEGNSLEVKWQANINVKPSSDTKVEVGIENENNEFYTSSETARLSKSLVPTKLIIDEKSNRIIGQTKTNDLVDINLSTGEQVHLDGSSQIDYFFNPMVYREKSNSIVWTKSETNGEQELFSLYETKIENNETQLIDQIHSEKYDFGGMVTFSQQRDIAFYLKDRDGDHSAKVYQFDFNTQEQSVLYQYPYGSYFIVDMVANEKYLYIAERNSSMQYQLVRISLESGIKKVLAQQTVGNFSKLILDNNTLLIADSNGVTSFDLQTEKVLDVIKWQTNQFELEQPYSYVYDKNKNSILIGDRVFKGIITGDIESGKLSSYLETGIGAGPKLQRVELSTLTDSNRAIVFDTDFFGENAWFTEIDLSTGNREVLYEFSRNEGGFWSNVLGLDYISKDNALILTTKNKVYIYNLISLEMKVVEISKLNSYSGQEIISASYDKVHNQLIVLGDDSTSIYRINIKNEEAELISNITESVNDISGIAFSSKNNELYISSELSEQVYLWDLNQDKLTVLPNCTRTSTIDDLFGHKSFHKPFVEMSNNILITTNYNAVSIYDLLNFSCETINVYDSKSMSSREFLSYIDINITDTGEVYGSMGHELFQFDLNTKEVVSLSGGIYGTKNINQSDIKPSNFIFPNKETVELNNLQTSSIITIEDITEDSPVSIVNGEYSINNNDFIDVSGFVKLGDTIKVRHLSSSEYQSKQVTLLNVGGELGVFATTTKAEVLSSDRTPNPINFNSAINADLNSILISNEYTVSGINAETSIKVKFGKYAINDGEFTNNDGVVKNGDRIKVQSVSSALTATPKSTWITIGNIKASFTSITKP